MNMVISSNPSTQPLQKDDALILDMSQFKNDGNNTTNTADGTFFLLETSPTLTIHSIGDYWWSSSLAYLESLTRDDILSAPKANIPELSLPFQFESHLEDAMAMVELIPSVDKVRYRTVPTRLNEEEFWKRLFALVRAHLRTSKQNSLESPPPLFQPMTIDELNQVESTEDLRNRYMELAEEYYKYRSCIADLEEQLRFCRTQILASTPSVCSNCSSSGYSLGQDAVVGAMANGHGNEAMNYKHAGRWLVDSNSEEFLALGEDIKRKLREEKQRRLGEVRRELNWILDSDDVSSTHGRWSCCQVDVYDTRGCALAASGITPTSTPSFEQQIK